MQHATRIYKSPKQGLAKKIITALTSHQRNKTEYSLKNVGKEKLQLDKNKQVMQLNHSEAD